MPEVVKEFIIALQKEIDAIKAGKGGSVVKVYNGKFIRKTSEFYIYVFHLENFLVAMDDTPAEIEINGSHYSCQIVSNQGLEIEIAIEQDLGNQIAEAKLQTNLWFLLEMLRKKYEDSSSEPKQFGMSEKLFAGISELLVDGNVEIEYTTSHGKVPNDSQREAINAAAKNSLAIVWGPPGTGKTTTIAQIVEAHINLGHRVLLVSHANAAVDQALKDIAAHLENSIYQEGKLVRLGIIQLKELEEKYPLVILDQIAAKLGETLVVEKNNLTGEQKEITDFLNEFAVIIAQYQALQQITQEIKNIEKSQSDLKVQVKQIKDELSAKSTEMQALQEKLVVAKQSGAFKRFIFGIDPVKIQRLIDELKITIDTAKRKLLVSEQKLAETVQLLNERKRDYHQTNDTFTELLAKYHIDYETVSQQKEEKQKRLEIVLSRIAEIDKLLAEIEKNILLEAKLVATTLTKTFSSKQFPDIPFDVLIIDEASMAPLPQVYWAACKAKKAIVIVGDFKQLPPICISDDLMAQKWLGRSIFDVLGIQTVQLAAADQRLTMLDTQYRMAPEIADISNSLFYEGRLKNHRCTESLQFNDSISGNHKLVVINTSEINPWGSQLSSGGRFNLYHALVTCTLAKKVLNALSHASKVGIIVPYRAQAKLIGKIIEEWGFLERIHVDNVHRFQGSEEEVILFDCVEGPGLRKWSLLDDKSRGSDANLLLNVAMTRAKCKIYMIAHKNYLTATYHRDSVIMRVLRLFEENGLEISSNDLIDNYWADDFEKWATQLLGAGGDSAGFEGSFFTEKNFWPVFLYDLKNSRNSLIIMSPFISLNRIGKMMDFFRVLIKNGLEIRIYTRPPGDQSGNLREHATQAIEQFGKIGIKVILRKSMHQKIALIDGRIAWEGSLNILSHNTTQEQMRRIVGEKIVKEIIRNLELESDEVAGNYSNIKCPVCQAEGIESYMVYRKGKWGMFLGCERYACKHIINIKRRKKQSFSCENNN